MKDINTYLVFDGNCREAMTFYKQCLQGELFIVPFSEAPIEMAARGAGDRIMHASLKAGSGVLMASDSMPDMPVRQGDNFSISLNCESLEETDRLFNALADKGHIKMPLQQTFWATRFGMLTDRFGINWMFNFEQPK